MPRCCFCCPRTDAGCDRCKAGGVFVQIRDVPRRLTGWAHTTFWFLGRGGSWQAGADAPLVPASGSEQTWTAISPGPWPPCSAHVVSLLSFSCIGLRCENQTLGKDPSYIFLSPISPLHASARRARYTCRSALWHVQHDLIWWIERHPVALYLDRSINPYWQSRGHQGPKQCPPGFPLPWS